MVRGATDVIVGLNGINVSVGAGSNAGGVRVRTGRSLIGVDAGTAGAMAATPGRDGASATSASDMGLSGAIFPGVKASHPALVVAMSPPGVPNRASPRF